MGKRIAESRGEVELSAAILQYFADNAAEFLASKAIKSAIGSAAQDTKALSAAAKASIS
jgi:succinate-semialdehyde dehydrogenase/glutarate-semialdehyde dehydrogenase